MELGVYVESIRRQFMATAEVMAPAEAGEALDEAKARAERLFAPLEAAIRLSLQDVLAAAAEQITCELAPGSVELRIRGRDPEFVVSLPPTEPGPAETDYPVSGVGSPEVEEGATARINLRLPEHLKARVDQAAAREGLSINTWLVRATNAALERGGSARRQDRRAATGSQRYTGWSR